MDTDFKQVNNTILSLSDSLYAKAKSHLEAAKVWGTIIFVYNLIVICIMAAYGIYFIALARINNGGQE